MSVIGEPDLEPEEGWVPLDLGEEMGARASSFVSGAGNGRRLRVRYFRCDQRTLAGKAWFGPDAEGPPGHAHGGAIASVLDEAMGAAAWASGHTAVAASITVHFREMLPLGTVCRIGAWVSGVDGRKVRTHGVLAAPNGQTVANAEGLFVAVDPARMGDLAERALRVLGRAP